jgi:hypothetical protein
LPDVDLEIFGMPLTTISAGKVLHDYGLAAKQAGITLEIVSLILIYFNRGLHFRSVSLGLTLISSDASLFPRAIAKGQLLT